MAIIYKSVIFHFLLFALHLIFYSLYLHLNKIYKQVC